MPLFGHHNNPTTTTGPNVLHKNGDPAYNNNTTTTAGHHGHTGPGPAIGTAAGAAAGHHEGHTATGALLGGAAGHHHAQNHPAPVEGTVPSGVGMGQTHHVPGATTNVGGAAIPASGAHMQQGGNAGVSTAGASEKMFAGKLEHAAGAVLCSSTLKAKGLEKEREGQAMKVQAAEIGAAERLEGEANVRRERAVAHGAHPHHLHGGGGGAGAGAPAGDTYGGGVGPTGYAGGPTNVNQVGGTGVGGAGGLGPQGGAGLR